MANDPTDDNFEDADFEDLDPIEDDDLSDDLGGDDAWEDDAAPEGDDDLSSSDDDDAVADDAAPVKGKKAKKVREPGEKTFVQKNFVMIVGAVVVVFGGVIGMSMMSGGSSAPAPDGESADALPAENGGVTELAENGEMPPMPAPISSEAPAADGALTPMPTPEDLQNTELAELTIDEVPATPAAGTTKQGEAPFDFAEQPAPEAPAEEAPPVAEDVPVTPAVAAVQGSALELPEEIAKEKETGKPVLNGAERMNMQFRKLAGTLPADVADATAPTIKEEKEEEQPSEEALPPSLEQAAAPDLSPQLEAQKSEIDSLQGKLQDQQAQAEKSQQDLQASLSAKDDEIAKLQKSLKDLEAKLANAQSDVDSANEAAAKAGQSAKAAADKAAKTLKEAAKTPAPAIEPPAEEPEMIAEAQPESEATPVPAPKKAAADPAAPREAALVVAKVLSWELKGASNGKAVLSSKTNGDTRNVAVGDSVEGLGKITMIAKENGRWTVRGTKGSVVR